MEIIWKDVPSYEGYYQVSSCGLVKSVQRIVKYRENHSGLRKERILKSNVTKGGYVHATICINKENKTVKVHRLVALAFIPNPENKPCVNHINGIKTDNRAENLEWCTYGENTQHAYKTKLKNGIKGEKSHLSKLKKEDVMKIRLLYDKGCYSHTKLGKMFNVSQSQISRIVNNINWTL
jgi:hypothetical protein